MGTMASLQSKYTGLLQTEELYEYILESSVYPREPESLKEIRAVSASHPRAKIATASDAGQLITMLLNLINAKKTIEIRIFTGYSLLLTALSIPDDGKIIAIDVDREAYEIGLPVIKKAGSQNSLFTHKLCQPLTTSWRRMKMKGVLTLDLLMLIRKIIRITMERLMKLIRVGGLIVYDNTLWGESVAVPEDAGMSEKMRLSRPFLIELTKILVADTRIQMSHVPVGDGIIICRRLF